jgi:hypothetical protein
MGFWDSMDERVKKMEVLDIGLIKWAAFFMAIIIVKIFPQLLKISYPILTMLVIACSARPLYKFWLKN